MTPPPDDSANGAKAAPKRPSPPAWRLAFDAVERPIGAASETWVQSDVFMDALALTWKVQQRVAREMNRGLGVWFGLWGMPRRSDVNALVRQGASPRRHGAPKA